MTPERVPPLLLTEHKVHHAYTSIDSIDAIRDQEQRSIAAAVAEP